MSKDKDHMSDYRVLARKYRPQTFSELIGQDPMVQTLANAIKGDRIAHAFVLTGVRGVGKTTTARLIAKALNCTGKDGSGEMTIDPCGVCDSCLSIASSRHVDVLEMDAASRTGVDDIREIIDSVQYAPASARYKIYIVDEVHMLTRNAFNALLKTLEEPPPHVKFIFATTEVRKMPITVLSRCQRFDLRRVPGEILIGHLENIVAAEKTKVDQGALALIARAAEGSVRDALSLLDQAVSHGGGKVTAEQVGRMLGLADRSRIMDLFESLLAGEIKPALKILQDQYELGADPAVLLKDLAETTHWITRLKVSKDAGSDALVSDDEKERGRKLVEKLKLAELTRAWQILLKGIQEVRNADFPFAAAEMVAIRLAHAAHMPTPADLIARFEGGEAPKPAKPKGRNPTEKSSGPDSPAPAGGTESSEPVARPRALEQDQPPAADTVGGGPLLALKQQTAEANVPEEPMPISFRALVELFETRKEGVIGKYLRDDVSLRSYKPGTIAITPLRKVPLTLASRMKTCLKAWTGQEWQIVIEKEIGEETLKNQDEAAEKALFEKIAADPSVESLLAAFPDAKITRVELVQDMSEDVGVSEDKK